MADAHITGMSRAVSRHPEPAAGTQVTEAVVVPSSNLLGQARTLTIEHLGMLYTLRVTRNGKLILTK
jgi:hemin uptake protein HemP